MKIKSDQAIRAFQVIFETCRDYPSTGDFFIRFTPSRTPLGKNLPQDINSILKDSLQTMDSDQALAAALKRL